MTALFLLIALLLLLLNGFFVLAEFAIVKMRSSKVEELIDRGHVRARLVKHIQGRIDEYLSVCQVGITLASIGLGFVGEPAFARLVQPAFEWTGAGPAVAHGIAITVAYGIVSFLHIWLGEQVPKMVAIRRSDRMALLTAMPLKVFRWLFYAPLLLLSGATQLVLKPFGVGRDKKEAQHTEQELKILLAQSQERGLISFRRLLLVENVFDLGDLKVRDAMRPREAAKVLYAGDPWEENLKLLRASRFSRYPLVDRASGEPVGLIHVKDLLYGDNERVAAEDLRRLARPLITATEAAPLENLLADLQGKRGHLAIVRNAQGKWTGFISLEDIIEEIVGTIEDEFELDPQIMLADVITPGRIVLGVAAASLEEAIERVFERLAASELPGPPERIRRAVLDRERAMSTYLGRGLAIPHARLEGLKKPILILARSEEGVPIAGREEKAQLIFILLTPSEAPRVQARLLARIAGLMESDFVVERLLESATASSVFDAIRAGDPVALS